MKVEERWIVVAAGAFRAADLRAALEGARVVAEERSGFVLRLEAEGELLPIRPALLERAHGQGHALAVYPKGAFSPPGRLVVFDMDSTLVSIEVVDELARAAGRYEEVAAITARAMRGELDFEQSLRARVGLLAGTSEEVLERIAAELPLTEGAAHLAEALKARGIRLAVLSGGFVPPVEALRERLGFDHAHANRLEVRDGRFTGDLVGPIVGPEQKAALLEEIARKEGVPLREVVAVGDGANDRLMLEKAGLGVAFRAKAALRQVADATLDVGGLEGILPLLGLD